MAPAAADTEQMIQAEAEYIYRSKLPDIYIPDKMPLHKYCFEKLADVADRPCLIDGASGKIWTYAEVELASRRVGAGLARFGIGRGDVVMLLLQNRAEFAFTFLGASMRGAVVTTANPFYTPGEVAKQASASGARVVVTQAAFAEKLSAIRQRLSHVFTIDEAVPEGCLPFSALAEADEAELDGLADDIDAEEVVALPYSSGTTGLPKGVMLTHRSLVASVAQQVDGENPNLNFRSDDVILCVLPLFHIYSLNSVMLCALRVGAAILLMQKFNMGAMLDHIQKYGITVLPLVPPIVLEITKTPSLDAFDISSVRIIMCGAAPLGKDLEDALRDKFPKAIFGQGYGMTEAGPVLAMNLAFAKEPFPVKSGSCGTVVRNAEIKIIDTETGVSLPHNQCGEICIRGPEIMKGYLNDPEATALTIDKHGWLHTGDVGYIDDDEELFIVDRVKEIIKYKGFQVSRIDFESL
eukprot:TRINITY_DN20220_c0_g1_i3.p1 TRINITY_DN20220_c0_g1~~TRINITY_DN20220_c0_g1_i3.p1  ORF type:complete len:466 (+),score=-31.77 TRINITY_DN20220_c0_g1_i3:303-1700(+)